MSKEPTYRLVPVEDEKKKKKREKRSKGKAGGKSMRGTEGEVLKTGLVSVWSGLMMIGRGVVRVIAIFQKENKGRWASVGPQLLLFTGIGFFLGYLYAFMRG